MCPQEVPIRKNNGYFMSFGKSSDSRKSNSRSKQSFSFGDKEIVVRRVDLPMEKVEEGSEEHKASVSKERKKKKKKMSYAKIMGHARLPPEDYSSDCDEEKLVSSRLE